MKLNVTKKTDDRVEFTVSGIKENLANTLRRTTISDIPTLAIEEVTFYQNSSVIDDEVLAHRLGLVPLKTPVKSAEQIELTLKAEGPGTVYASQLQVKEAKTRGKAKKTDTIAAFDDMPVVKLVEGQTLEFEALARLGTGKEHIKWQGGLASYEIKDDGSFDFFIESYGQMPINEFIDSIFGVIESNIKDLKALIK